MIIIVQNIDYNQYSYQTYSSQLIWKSILAICDWSTKFPDYKMEILAYDKRWDEMIAGPIEHTVEILHKLKANDNIKLFALTNWSEEKFPVAQEKFEFLKVFEHIVVSGELKLVKPDPNIYHHLLNTQNLTAHETLFIDDRDTNVTGAESVGIKAHHFKTPKALEDLLRELGLLP